VPSKMSWLTFTGFVNVAQCCHVPLTRAFAIRLSAEYRRCSRDRLNRVYETRLLIGTSVGGFADAARRSAEAQERALTIEPERFDRESSVGVLSSASPSVLPMRKSVEPTRNIGLLTSLALRLNGP
jgi:hypothetical protein